MKFWSRPRGISRFCPECGCKLYELNNMAVRDFEATSFCRSCRWTGIIIDCPVIKTATQEDADKAKAGESSMCKKINILAHDFPEMEE